MLADWLECHNSGDCSSLVVNRSVLSLWVTGIRSFNSHCSESLSDFCHSLKKISFLNVYMWVLECIYVLCVYAWCPEAWVDIGSFGPRVPGRCKLPDVDGGNQLHVLCQCSEPRSIISSSCHPLFIFKELCEREGGSLEWWLTVLLSSKVGIWSLEPIHAW